MRVLLLGNGGREHALAIKLTENKSCELFIAPGNPGTNQVGKNIQLNINDFGAVKEFCIQENIDLVVAGAEKQLVDGLGDFLRRSGIPFFGPDKNAAAIEGDKAFAKNLMNKYKIPTASYKIFDKSSYSDALSYLEQISYPTVIKASGLAAGKGVLICEDIDSARNALKDCFNDSVFGSAGDTIVIEEFMVGEEASLFVITDGKDFISLPVAQDHKRVGEGDTGKNTGGMGAYAPAPLVDDTLLTLVENLIIQPTLDALNREGAAFIGCLYCGLMITSEGPKVVEFNCRFGDPETQVVLPLLEGDFLELIYSASIQKLNKQEVKYNGGCAICVVLASEGYPDDYNKGYEISIGDLEKNTIIYHAGTALKDNRLITSGGRVLGVTSFHPENNLQNCFHKVYNEINKIDFKNKYYRNDIAHRAIK